MGTNYYAQVHRCKHCDHPRSEIHIGKSSAGWTFSFHATDELRSWAQWREFLGRPEVEIRDEYERPVGFGEFCDLVESKRHEKRNHAKLMIARDPQMGPLARSDGQFLDPEGHSFSEGEFS